MIDINLLPLEIKLKSKMAKESANFAITMLSFFAIIGVLVIALFITEMIYKTNLDNTLSKITTEEKKPLAYEDIKSKTLFIKDRVMDLSSLKNKKNQWSLNLQELTKIVPDSITLKDFSVDIKANPSIKIQGLASENTSAMLLKEQLEASNYYKDVYLESSKIVNIDGVNYYDFSLTANPEVITKK